MTAQSIRWLTLFLDLPAAEFDADVRFWLEVTASELSPRRGPDGEFATLLPPHGDACLRVQRVRSGSGGHHLDLHIDPATETLADAAARAIALGGRQRSAEDGLIVLDSPGGFPFCLVTWTGEITVPAPVILDTGGPNRLDQLCLDIPPEAYESECRFWSSFTGWPRRSAGLPEFD